MAAGDAVRAASVSHPGGSAPPGGVVTTEARLIVLPGETTQVPVGAQDSATECNLRFYVQRTSAAPERQDADSWLCDWCRAHRATCSADERDQGTLGRQRTP
jgi:hypothetical protein